MARVYILNNVTLPSSADLDFGNENGSQYVVSDGFNSSNCKSTVTYYVTVDGNNYGSFTLTDNAVSWILDNFAIDSPYFGNGATRLPTIGELSLNSPDWDAQGGDAGWRWIGSSDAEVSIYYEEEIKYFENTELNILWNQLVTAIRSIQLPAEWRITPIPPTGDHEDWCGAYILEGGYLGAIADAYTLIEQDSGTVVTGFSVTDPIELSMLDRTKTYCITNGTGGNSGAYLRYEPIVMDGPGSVKELHDHLIKVLGLRRNVEPESIADYFKGLSVCAQYIHNRTTNTSYKYSLAEMVDVLRHIVTLSADGKASCLCDSADWYLYDAAGNQIENYAGPPPVDFSSNMTPGNTYYVWANDMIYNDYNVLYSTRISPKIVYAPKE